MAVVVDCAAQEPWRSASILGMARFGGLVDRIASADRCDAGCTPRVRRDHPSPRRGGGMTIDYAVTGTGAEGWRACSDSNDRHDQVTAAPNKHITTNTSKADR